MIFFTEHIEPYFKGEVLVSPITCELVTGEKGYHLGDDWAGELISKVGAIRYIDIDEIKCMLDEV